MSTQPCGCDPEALWLCKYHQMLETKHQILETKAYTESVSRTCVPSRASILPSTSTERKKYPIATGVLDYFPDAIAAIANVSFVGNEQHNPGQHLHWAREKSTDQDDTCMRHFLERGTRDVDGQRHTAKAAWRLLAILQLEIEAEQARATKPVSAVDNTPDGRYQS